VCVTVNANLKDETLSDFCCMSVSWSSHAVFMSFLSFYKLVNEHVLNDA
jgi:hypothetical protein